MVPTVFYKPRDKMTDQTDFIPSANNSTVSRRTVLKAAAWSLPAIAVASATPALAASEQCVTGPVAVTALNWSSTGDLQSNWLGKTTTGWIGTFSGSPGGDATENVTSLSDGFLSQDDNDSNTEIATVTMQASIQVVAGATYQLDMSTAVGYGNPGGFNGSARQSLVLSLIQPDVTSTDLLKLTVNHWDAPTISPTDSDMKADGYILQQESTTATRQIAFTASSTGTAILNYAFTIQPMIGANRSDDIAVGIPSIASQTCA